LTVLNDLEEPVVGSPTSLAASIVRCGAVRRGEISEVPMPTNKMAAAIVRAGMRRRGEIEPDRKPQSQAEVMATKIIQAGRRRRGEIE